MTWYVRLTNIEDETIAKLLDYGTVDIIGDCVAKVVTYKEMKQKLLNIPSVLEVSNRKFE